MKKIISIIMILVVIFAFGGCAFVEIKEKGVGVARFIYDGENISADISERDLETIFNIFEGKKLYSDSPACSFTEKVAVIIDDQTFCIANDTCGTIYLKEEDKYFGITDDENERLRELLEGYGFSFPCL